MENATCGLARRPVNFGSKYPDSEGYNMSQYGIKQGLKLFGPRGSDAVLNELKQLHDLKVMEPKHASELTHEQRRGALPYLMFLKEKRCGKIKGRGCADGRKQRDYINKEDASSPTVAIESVFLTCVIDAKEKRDVATIDIPGAFMQVDMDELVHMELRGEMVDLLVKIDPKLYHKYTKIVKGRPVLYVVLKKALYGTLRAALLFWRKLTKHLVDQGFVINPYNWCVVNKTINNKQCTIVWHVDDLKISHVKDDTVTDVINVIEEEFGREAPLTIHRGKVHEYLGMTLDFSKPECVEVSMIKYINEMLDELPSDMNGEAATPAANHLFNINDVNPTFLDEPTSDFFHHNVAKLLFLCKRARPDIQTAVAFLCTRV